ncbi:MAG: hypothetical protein LBG15_04595 [Dysgonamonadaceae bacterium]|nr:hypothetical protein [Dysgonamonadaceae bacterium]
MKYRITPHLIELTYEASLKSFWRKNALKKFLRGCNISEYYLNTWNEEETKRNFLDRLFMEFQKSDKGKRPVFDIAVALSEQETFPDLKNWEDSEEKIREARIAVSELRKFLTMQTKEIENEETKEKRRKEAAFERTKIQREITDKQKLKEEIEKLSLKIGTQEAGYKFQKWFYSLLDFCEIDNKRPYVQNGRQIDGALTLEGTTFLIELKFTSSQSDATDVDSMKGKIDKMADNTMGIVVSMSGYSSVAIKQASGPKTPLLLLDASHLFLYLTGGMEFGDIIARVKRHASQTGESYLSVSDFSK